MCHPKKMPSNLARAHMSGERACGRRKIPPAGAEPHHPLSTQPRPAPLLPGGPSQRAPTFPTAPLVASNARGIGIRTRSPRHLSRRPANARAPVRWRRRAAVHPTPAPATAFIPARQRQRQRQQRPVVLIRTPARIPPRLFKGRPICSPGGRSPPHYASRPSPRPSSSSSPPHHPRPPHPAPPPLRALEVRHTQHSLLGGPVFACEFHGGMLNYANFLAMPDNLVVIIAAVLILGLHNSISRPWANGEAYCA
jgi:hypothetical protein